MIKDRTMTRKPPTLRQVFAANLRRARQSQCMSQEELADRAGLHRNSIGAMERGETNVPLDSLEAVSLALGLEAAYLVRRV
jgi:transcriptional regulator with XRE-family HTH domain